MSFLHRTRRWLGAGLCAAVLVGVPGPAAYQAAAAEFEGPSPGAGEAAPIPRLPKGAVVASPAAPGSNPPQAQVVEAPGAPSARPPAQTAAPADGAPIEQAAQEPRPAAERLDAAAGAASRAVEAGPALADEAASQTADFADGQTAAPTLAAVPSRGPGALAKAGLSKAKAALTFAREVSIGARGRLADIVAGRRTEMRKTRGLLAADGVLSMALTLLTGPLIDTARAAAEHGIASHLHSLAWYTAGIIASFAAYIYVERLHVLKRRILGLFSAKDYRVALDESLLNQEFEFHQTKEHSSGALAKRVLGDTNYLSTKNVSIPLEVTGSLVAFAFGTALMLWINPVLAAAVLAIVPALGVLNGYFADKVNQIHFKLSDDQAELMRRSQEAVSQAATVKAADNVAKETQRYAAQADAIRDLGEQDARLHAHYGLFAGVLMTVFTRYLIFIIGGLLAAMHQMTFGQIVQMSAAAGFVGLACIGLSDTILMAKRYAGSSTVVTEMLTRTPEIADGAIDLPDMAGGVAFERVSFAYPSRKGEGSVLDEVSFEAKPGQAIAFVGETGSGKSTITRLLLRLWDPNAGRVLIDGTDLRELKRESFLAQVAVVPQDTRLFNNTIRFNMTYGAGEVSEEQLAQAIKQAKAEFVYNTKLFPDGLRTTVSEGGARLSGGEKQRIAIVRALLRQPRILVLDEATSALDNASEKVVQTALDGLVSGQGGRKPTTIVVAHRLTTVQNVDRIYVLDKGRIVESGTHAELLDKGGRYAALWRKGGYAAGPQGPPANAIGHAAVAGGLGLGSGLAALAAVVWWKAFTVGAAGMFLPGLSLGALLPAAGAVLLGFGGLIFAAAAARIAWAMWRRAGESAAGPAWERAFFRAVATPSGQAAAFDSLPLWIKTLLQAHEAAHEKGRGEVGALWAEAKAIPAAVGRMIHSLRRGATKVWAILRPWALADRVLKPILRPYRWKMAAAIAAVAAKAALGVGGSWIVGRLLDFAEAASKGSGHFVLLGPLTFYMALLLVALASVTWVTEYLSGALQARILKDIRARLFAVFLGREMAFHLRHDSGQLASALNDDAEALARKTVADRLPVLGGLLTLAVSAALLLHTSLAIGVVVLVVMGVIGIVNGKKGQQFDASYVEFSRLRREYGSSSQEVFDHIQVVKMFGQEKAEVQRNAERAEALAQSGVPGAYLMADAHMLSSSVNDFFTKHALYIGGAWKVALGAAFLAWGLGSVGIGTLLAMTFYAGFIKESFDALSKAWMDYKQSHGETKMIRRWLAQPAAIRDLPGAIPLAVSRGEVRFEGVSFRYAESGNGAGGLSDFSLDVQPGETVAFVGETGAGKSTVLKLLQRQWEPGFGRVLIDGQDVRQVTLGSLSRGIAVVPQETRLFDDTVRYNLLYGNESATEEELLAAVKAARAEFLFDRGIFPDGLETRVGEGGAQLSGGQAQRIAIVRAILKKPRVLLLDEATSKLDKQTETEIQETLDRIAHGGIGGQKPTTLVIAHNLTTVMRADRIVVLDRGRIAEQGTHAELLARGGAYHKLWMAAQQQGKDSAPAPGAAQ